MSGFILLLITLSFWVVFILALAFTGVSQNNMHTQIICHGKQLYEITVDDKMEITKVTILVKEKCQWI